MTPESIFPLDILKSTPSIAAVTLQYPATKKSAVTLVSILFVLLIKCLTKVVLDGENKYISPEQLPSLSLLIFFPIV